MSKETDWLAQFTGLDLKTGASAGPDPAAAAREFEERQLLKLAALTEARAEIAKVKSAFQAAMASELKIKGKKQKDKLLEIEKTQADEAEFEDIEFGSVELEPKTMEVINHGMVTIVNVAERLKAKTWKDKSPLFEPPELQREYWTPLMRERILPETFIGRIYSETQQMLDATNEAYEAAVAEKAAKGELTPASDRGRDLIDSGAELLSVAGSLAGVGGNSKDVQLAKSILSTAAGVVRQGGNAYDKIKGKQYADAASLALGAVRDITTSVLKGVGVPDAAVGAAKAGFGAGDAAIKAGKAFASGIDGAAEGAGHFATVIESALNSAIQVTTGTHQENLSRAVAVVPAIFRQAGIVAELRSKLMADPPDVNGLVDCLVRSADGAFKSVRGFQLAEATAGKSADQKALITKAFEKDTEALQAIIATGGATATMAVKSALLAQQGKFLQSLNGLIQDVGSGLSKALVAGGVDAKQAETIAALYQAAASAPAAFEALAQPQPDVDKAMQALAGGMDKAFASFAGDDEALKATGASLSTTLRALGKGARTAELFKQGQVEQGVQNFIDTVTGGLAGALGAAKAGGGKSDPAAQALIKELEAAGKALGAQKETLAKGLDAAVAALRQAHNEEAVAEIMAEVEDDLARGEAALKAAADASTIDALIAKMERDRMVMKLAVQIMEGGSAFLSKFIPGLGIAGAAAQLAAQLYAAAMRAQQMNRWMNSQSDLEAAQSALSSSARNFVKNQREQFASYAINAALEASRLVAEACKVSGVAAAAGAALDGATSAAKSIKTIVEKHQKREALEQAWKVTAASLRNPTNRKLGLKARALNPTLAKYSIAWGAVELKDPLARQAMRACDLNEATLNNPGANVGKVVEYLEKFYEDDQKIYRETLEKADWLPKELDLGLRGWAQLKRNAQQKISLDTGGTGRIDGLLAEWDELEAAPAPKDDDLPARQQQARRRDALLRALDAAFAGYAPKLASGAKPNEKALELMRNAVVLLRRQVAGAQKAVDAELAELARREKEGASA